MILPEDARSVVVTTQDATELGFCMKAVRSFCLAHGIDFRSFVENGIEGDALLPLNDHNALEMVEHAMARQAQGGGQ